MWNEHKNQSNVMMLMRVDFILEDGEKGKKIVGGAKSCYPTDDLSWLDFNGKKIMIRTLEGDLYFKVSRIDVFNSISGAINIGLTLNEDIRLDAIHIGDLVFKVISELS